MTSIPPRVNKGWGWETWVHNDEKYCGKILTVWGSKRCSLHYHEKKTETFYLLSGYIWVRVQYRPNEHEINEHNFKMQPGDVLELPPGTIHQFGSIATTSEIMEVSTQHFEEDSIRLEKGD